MVDSRIIGVNYSASAARSRAGVKARGFQTETLPASSSGAINTEGLIVAVLANRPHPEQGFRTCLGVLRLFRGLDLARAEAVAGRALAIGALTYKSVASILNNNLDRAPQSAETPTVIEDGSKCLRRETVVAR
jgi:hypothetical protein